MRGYYLMRITRIEPPLVINLYIAFLALVVINHASIADPFLML